jgi:uncharacterized protein YbjT (DUF2867 family)
MKILILGGKGFLGKTVASNLKGKVYTFGRENQNDYKGDISNLEDLKKVIPRFDIIINLVGLTPIKEPKKASYSDIHITGVRNILFSLKKNQRLIHISAIGASEDSQNEYLRTKGKAEKLIISSKANALIIRPSMIFGSNSELFKSIKHVPFFPMFKFKVQPIHDLDIAKIINKYLTNKKGIIEVAGKKEMTFYDFIKKYKKAKKQILIGIPLFVFKPFFYALTHLKLFGLSKNQWLLIKKDNISKKTLKFNYQDYDSWLQNL